MRRDPDAAADLIERVLAAAQSRGPQDADD